MLSNCSKRKIVVWLLLIFIPYVTTPNIKEDAVPTLSIIIKVASSGVDFYFDNRLSESQYGVMLTSPLFVRGLSINGKKKEYPWKLDINEVNYKVANFTRPPPPSGGNLEKETFETALYYILESSKIPLEILLPRSLGQYVGNYSCIFEMLNSIDINYNVVNVTISYRPLSSNLSIVYSYSPIIKNLFNQCYFGGKNETMVNWNILDFLINYPERNGVSLSGIYVIEFLEDIHDSKFHAMCEKFKFTECKMMTDTQYSLRDPQSRSIKEIIEAVNSLEGSQFKYILNIQNGNESDIGEHYIVGGKEYIVHLYDGARSIFPSDNYLNKTTTPKFVEVGVTQEPKSSDTTFITTTEPIWESSTMPPETTETVDNFDLGKIEDETLIETTTIPMDRDGKQITGKCYSDSNFNAVGSNSNNSSEKCNSTYIIDFIVSYAIFTILAFIVLTVIYFTRVRKIVVFITILIIIVLEICILIFLISMHNAIISSNIITILYVMSLSKLFLLYLGIIQEKLSNLWILLCISLLFMLIPVPKIILIMRE